MKYRSVQLGVIAISIASISILLLTMFFFYKVQQRENERIISITNNQRQMMVDNILDLKLTQEEGPVFDNSAWDELQDAMKDGDMEWIDVNVGYMSIQYNAATVAVFDADCKLVYDNITDNYKDKGIDFYADIRLPAMFRDKYKNIFYSIKNEKLYSYYVYKIVSSDDILTRKEPGTGYLMLVKEYSDSLIADYSKSLGSMTMNLAFSKNTVDVLEIANKGDYFYSIPLKNQYGNPVAYLYFTANNEVDDIFLRLFKLMLAIFGMVLGMLLSLMIYTQYKIIRPLHRVVDVFYKGDVSKITNMMGSKSEFGVLSKNIDKFFKQKVLAEQLHKEMVERNKMLTDQQDLVNELQHKVEANEDTIETLHRHIADANRDKELKGAQLSINEQMLEEQMDNIMRLGAQIDNLKETLKVYEKQLGSSNLIISDNRNYAVRLRNVLQVAITPTKHVLTDFFLYEKPKDSIGGDFSFAKTIDNYVIAGVGDCNLQGVSGAMLSSVDLYLLIDILQHKRTSELRPDLILNELNRKIQTSIGTELDSDIERDGLHLSIFMYDTTTYKAYYASSKRTMVLVRRGEVMEYFGDNLSVGKVHDDKKFNCINFNIEPEDMVYMYTDGCTEVVGGPYCKKLLAVNLKKEIAKRQSMTIAAQKLSFKEFYENWIGDLVQSDDITLLGFKID
ncbi:MAG: SpoIIE family protein phosphatase [Bacteroidales bacterium]|nr:SpoIIE family protein phosphatase [Bacteroidales bacterium]